MQNSFSDFLNESWVEWLGLAVAIGFLIWVSLRIRSYFLEDTDTEDECDFLLSQARELRQQGDLSEEEFRKLKNRIVAKSNSPQPPPPDSP